MAPPTPPTSPTSTPTTTTTPTPRVPLGAPVSADLMAEARRLRTVAAISGAVGGYAKQLTESTRLRQEWTAAVGAADQIQGDDRDRIVAFSRRLCFQSPVARAVIDAMVREVVGEGIFPQGETDAAERAAQAFWDWADTELGIDIGRRDGFGGIQSLWVREMLVGGDVLINRASVSDHPLGIATQTVESERIVGGPRGTFTAPTSVSGFGRRAARGEDQRGPRIVDGVELDDYGRAVRYHVARYAYIGAGSSVLAGDTTPLDARAATLLAYRTRAGQTRGLPYLTPAMGRLAGLEEYTGAVEVAAKLHAMVAIITKTMSPQAMLDQMGVGSTSVPETETAGGGGGLGGGTTSYDRTLLEAEPGMTFALGMGEEATTLSPSQPGQTHETFVRTTVAQVCAVLGIPIEVAMGDFSRANFSVARMALLLAQRTAAPVQDQVVRTVLTPVYRWWLAHALERGIVTGDPAELRRIRWRGPKRLIVDPQKEAAATAAAIAANLTTYTEELDALGKRRDDVFAMRSAENAQMRLLGIEPPAPAGSAPRPERAADTPADDGDGDNNAAS